uniref:Uncharacterized protein n=1 Tax=Glossina pallidipes TaxID=7398 RepID=A0A1A9ZRK3_GLOPL
MKNSLYTYFAKRALLSIDKPFVCVAVNGAAVDDDAGVVKVPSSPITSPSTSALPQPPTPVPIATINRASELCDCCMELRLLLCCGVLPPPQLLLLLLASLTLLPLMAACNCCLWCCADVVSFVSPSSLLLEFELLEELLTESLRWLAARLRNGARVSTSELSELSLKSNALKSAFDLDISRLNSRVTRKS